MKNAILLIFSALIFSCTSNVNKPETEVFDSPFSIHMFKLDGLNDSVIQDSVWKMIFTIDGIEELNIDRKDSLLTIKTVDSIVKIETIEKEILLRGATIIEKKM